MRKVSIVAMLAFVTGLSGVGPSVASSGGMGDPSAHMRYMQEICDAQKRGEYPRYHEACLPDDRGPPLPR
jgi:hypothetical protein